MLATPNLPARYEVGGLQLSAVVTVALLALCTATIVRSRPHGLAVARPLVPLAGFVAWMLTLGVLRGFGDRGLEQVGVMALFGLMALVAARCDEDAALAARTWLLWTGWALAAVHAVALSVYGPHDRTLLSPRSFAVAALLVIAVAVPRPSTDRLARWLPWVLSLLVLLSLSRAATGVAAVLLCVRLLHDAPGQRSRRTAAGAAALLAIGLAIAVLRTGTLHDRMFEVPPGQRPFSVAGVTINAQGRVELWRDLADEIRAPHLGGFGPGASSAHLVGKHGPVAEPHNDYLRVLFDGGSVGLLLLVGGVLHLLRHIVRRARAAGSDRLAAAPHMTAALAIGAVAITMLTDNPIIYTWVMAPAGVLVGLSLASTHAARNKPPLVGRDSAVRVATALTGRKGAGREVGGGLSTVDRPDIEAGGALGRTGVEHHARDWKAGALFQDD